MHVGAFWRRRRSHSGLVSLNRRRLIWASSNRAAILWRMSGPLKSGRYASHSGAPRALHNTMPLALHADRSDAQRKIAIDTIGNDEAKFSDLHW